MQRLVIVKIDKGHALSYFRLIGVEKLQNFSFHFQLILQVLPLNTKDFLP